MTKDPSHSPSVLGQGCLQLRGPSASSLRPRYAALRALDQTSGCGLGNLLKKKRVIDRDRSNSLTFTSITSTQHHRGKAMTEAQKSNRSRSRNVVISGLDIALLACLEPVMKTLDQDHPAELGHDAPSRKDGLLRILLNNFCRDVYQQIHGVNTDNYKFAGIKDNWDRAQNAVAQLVNRYSNNPEDMDADPNCAKFYTWYESASAKFEMLTSMLADLKGVYKTVTGEDWEYKAPGTGTTKTTLDPKTAAAKLRERMKAATEAKNSVAA